MLHDGGFVQRRHGNVRNVVGGIGVVGKECRGGVVSVNLGDVSHLVARHGGGTSGAQQVHFAAHAVISYNYFQC